MREVPGSNPIGDNAFFRGKTRSTVKIFKRLDKWQMNLHQASSIVIHYILFTISIAIPPLSEYKGSQKKILRRLGYQKHVLFWIIPFPLPIVNVELESIIGSDSMSVKLTSCPHVSDCIVMFLNEIFKRYLFCNFFCLLAKFATGSSQGNKSIISNADQTCN